MFITINAQFFHARVSPQFVASQSPSYSNPADPTNGGNDTLAATSEPPVLDPGPARIWGFTHPALSAVANGVEVPGIGIGINSPEVSNGNNFDICVTDSNGNPLNNATVKVCAQVTTGPNGIARLNLTPGNYTAEVIYNGETQSITEFNV